MFEGHWKHGIRSGDGVITNESGQVFKGKWVNGQFS